MTIIRYNRVKDQWPWISGPSLDVYQKGKDPYVISLSLSHTAAGTGYADIDAPDNVLTTLTGMQLVSSDASDASGAAGARAVTVFGCSGTDYVYRAFDMNGTTDITGFQLDGAFHMHVNDYGASGTSVGDITLTDGTDTYLTISAGEIDSNGCQFRLLDGYKGAMQQGSVKQTTFGGPTTDQQDIFIQFTPSGMASSIVDDNEEFGDIFSVNAYEGQAVIPPNATPSDGPWDGKIKSKYTGNGRKIKLEYDYIIWED